jgi:hypothetical protein
MESDAILSPIDTMLGVMLVSWKQKYSFEVDRVNKKGVFKRGPLTINAEENPDGQILITVLRGGTACSKTAPPEEAANSITSIIVDLMDEEIRLASKKWWQFWK